VPILNPKLLVQNPANLNPYNLQYGLIKKQGGDEDERQIKEEGSPAKSTEQDMKPPTKHITRAMQSWAGQLGTLNKNRQIHSCAVTAINIWYLFLVVIGFGLKATT
jgi:hypothetical protein